MKKELSVVLVALYVLGLAMIPGPSTSADEVGRCRSWVALERTEPSSPTGVPAGDLACLGQWVGDALIVGLGEDKHGTHTLHRLSHRIFQYLVEEEEFEVFALEIDQAHAAVLDRYVQGEIDDLQAQLGEGWWAQKIFYDAALEDLLRWMRRYNETAERPLHFAGYDAKQPRLAARELVQALGGAESAASEKVGKLFSEALAPGAFGMFPNVWGYTGTVRFALPRSEGAGVVRLDVGVRGEGVSYGSVGFSARIGTKTYPVVRWIPIEELRTGGSTSTTHSIELEPEDGDRSLEVSVFHRGDGTVWFEHPIIHLGGRRLEIPNGFSTIEVRSLMAPALQSMDYRADLMEDSVTGIPTLRVVADPLLEKSLTATRQAERQVESSLRDAAGENLSPAQKDWVRQLSRLVTQAVEWRVLVETNRDVFLAENLLWLHNTAFPGRRILALGHTSHTERRPSKMGSYLAEALGDAYQTVSMTSGSGSYRYFGDVSEAARDAPLELFEIDPAEVSELATAAGKLLPGSILLRLLESSGAPQPIDPTLMSPSSPDVLIYVSKVEPLRLLP